MNDLGIRKVSEKRNACKQEEVVSGMGGVVMMVPNSRWGK